MILLGYWSKSEIIRYFDLHMHLFWHYLSASLPVAIGIYLIRINYINKTNISFITLAFIIINCVFIFHVKHLFYFEDILVYVSTITPVILESNVMYMNNPAGNNNIYNQIVQGFVIGYGFPVYNPAGSNQPHLSALAAYLERARLRGRSALTEHTLSWTGHRFLEEYIRATDPGKHDDIYGAGRSSRKPAYWKLNINRTLINNIKNAN